MRPRDPATPACAGSWDIFDAIIDRPHHARPIRTPRSRRLLHPLPTRRSLPHRPGTRRLGASCATGRHPTQQESRMIAPDDPRHGTWAGYNQGCRTTCCREAARLYQKRRLHERRHRVNSLGLRRRIQALACLGWDMYAIARHIGTGRDTVRQWTIHDTVYRSTYNRMADVYDQLSMRFPPEDTKEQRANVTRTKTRARRNGWAPPLAWDNIDDPNEIPQNRKTRPLKTEIDPVVVQRVVDGDKLPMTHAERGEAVRRLRARGESFATIEQRHGLKAERYLAKRVAAAGDASPMPHITQGAA